MISHCDKIRKKCANIVFQHVQATGKLTITGAVALDWFVMRFAGVMNGYTVPVITGKKLKDPFDAEQMRLYKSIKKEMLHKRMTILFVSFAFTLFML